MFVICPFMLTTLKPYSWSLSSYLHSNETPQRRLCPIFLQDNFGLSIRLTTHYLRHHKRRKKRSSTQGQGNKRFENLLL